MPELLVVPVDFPDRQHAWIILGGVLVLCILLVPIQDAADKGGDQCGVSLRAGLDGLPSASHLDQDPVFRDPLLLVHADQLLRLCNTARDVEGEIRIDLSGDIAWDYLQDLTTN